MSRSVAGRAEQLYGLNMLIYVPSTRTFFSSSGVITVKRDQHELTSDCTGMVRLAVVSWKCSRIGQEAQATPNSYTGSGPLCPCRVRERRPCLRSRPRNLSVPNAVSSKRRDRPPRGVTVFLPFDHVGIETHCVGRTPWCLEREPLGIGAIGQEAASS